MTESSMPSTKTAWRMWWHQPFKSLGFSFGEKNAERPAEPRLLRRLNRLYLKRSRGYRGRPSLKQGGFPDAALPKARQ